MQQGDAAERNGWLDGPVSPDGGVVELVVKSVIGRHGAKLRVWFFLGLFFARLCSRPVGAETGLGRRAGVTVGFGSNENSRKQEEKVSSVAVQRMR